MHTWAALVRDSGQEKPFPLLWRNLRQNWALIGRPSTLTGWLVCAVSDVVHIKSDESKVKDEKRSLKPFISSWTTTNCAAADSHPSVKETNLITDRDNKVKIKLLNLISGCRCIAGDIVTFDNWRLLHGRKSYISSPHKLRHLEGAYLDWDEVMSRLRILRSSVQGGM